MQTFAPPETLLTGECSVFAKGFSDNTRLYELDVERYFSPRTFGKVFLFSSRAELLGLGSGLGGITLGQTRRTGVGVRVEHRIGSNLFTNFLMTYNRTTGETPGSFLEGQIAPYQPRHFARLAFNYVAPKGNKAGIAINNTGSFFQDSAFTGTTRPRFPSRTTVDLRLSREPSLKNEVFAGIANISNARQINLNGFPSRGRQFEVGYTRRF